MVTNVRKICVVTGSRAEYGILKGLLQALQLDERWELQLVATGMHLSPEFGMTFTEIHNDGFEINDKVEMLLSSDTPVGITKSLGLGIIGFADVFSKLNPDLILVLGDRFEILAAVEAALISKIPVAHIAGGDTSEGAYDEAIRHSITKMSHLHFVTNEMAAKRVRQLGENPEHVFMVGSPAIDQIVKLPLLDKATLGNMLDYEWKPANLLITFHPITLDDIPSEQQFARLLDALDRLGDDYGLIFTKPNADNDGRKLIQMLDQFAAVHHQAKVYTSLGQQRYFSAMSHVDVVVGNSSSGLYEAPSFRKPTVNIGNRQKGRLQANSVINCSCESNEIVAAIDKALQLDCSQTVNPYGNGDAVEKIMNILNGIHDLKPLVRKSFYEVYG